MKSYILKIMQYVHTESLECRPDFALNEYQGAFLALPSSFFSFLKYGHAVSRSWFKLFTTMNDICIY